MATYKNEISDTTTLCTPTSKLFPLYVYCFTCCRFSLLSEIEDGTYIRCPKCKNSSVHSCWWILYHHPVMMKDKCDGCNHKFFCWTNRCETDWDYQSLKDKGWEVLPRSVKTKAASNNLLGNRDVA